MKCFKILNVILGLGAFVCIVLGLALPGWSSYEVQEYNKRSNQSKPWTIFTLQSGLFSTRICTYSNGTEVGCDVKAIYQYVDEYRNGELSDAVMASYRLPRLCLGLGAGLMVLGLISLGCFTMIHSAFGTSTFTGSAICCVGLLGLAEMSVLCGMTIGLQNDLTKSTMLADAAHVYEELGYNVIYHFPWALLLIGIGAMCCFIIQLSVVLLLSRIQVFQGENKGRK